MIEKKKKIILIEDDLTIVDIYKTVIEKANFEVEVISLGQDAIKRLKEVDTDESSKPDLVLLDLILPDVNGIEVLREIRKNKTTKGIKVFVLTNQSDTQLKQFSDTKPDELIIKANITPSQLLELIKKYLK